MSAAARIIAALGAAVTVMLALFAAFALDGGDEPAAEERARERTASSNRDHRTPGRHARVATKPSLELTVLARGLVRPTSVGSAPGDLDGIWVAEQTGRVIRLEGGRQETVLDLRGKNSVGAERGLLGLAFHPDFARNRRFVVDYTDARGDTRIVEYRVGADGRVTSGSGRRLLRVKQPEENHNGGALLFATDGRLLVGMGDGGGAFDPRGAAQNPQRQLGKLLAADIDGAGSPRWSTVLSGLRNPWRIWIDPALNELWIGDVGQDHVEEIDRVRYEPSEPAKNLGWPAWEGDRALDRARLRTGATAVAPVAVYGHDEGCSVTAGVIYRGRALDALRERYVYGDFCTGTLWSLRPGPALSVADVRRETAHVPQLTSIGIDGHGELLFATGAGEIVAAVAP